MPIDLYSLLNLFIITQSLFFFILILAVPHGRPLAKAMLLVFVVSQLATPLASSLSLGSEISQLLINAVHYLIYLAGPSFYFYIKALRSPGFRLSYRQLWHLLPIILILGCAHFLWGDPEQGYLRVPAPLAPPLYLLSLVIWLLGYLIVGLRLLPGYQWIIKDFFAAKEDAIWRWLIVPVIFYITVYVVLMVGLVIQIALYPPLLDLGFAFTLIMSARIVFFYFVAIGGYKYRNLYEMVEETSPQEKYQTSALDDETLTTCWQAVTDYVNKHEPYLNTALKLPQLASELQMSGHVLSQVINSRTGKSFPDFINAYRADKVRVLIEEHAHSDQRMISLSQHAGFGNSATFYKYFKKHFNMTPAQYRKSCQKN